MFEDHDDRVYAVLRDGEGQYSIWPADRPVPNGWTPEGTTGTKTVCLKHIRGLRTPFGR